MRRHIMTGTGVLLLLSQPAGPPPAAWAQAAAEDSPSDGQRDSQRAAARERARLALQKGRALNQKGDLAGALKVFREAEPDDPENPALLSELGWAALRSHDLELALPATRKAAIYASEPRLQAAAQYNLGRIYEEKGDRAAAIEAYLDSLHTRSTTEARLRLEPLIPAAQPVVFKPMTKVAGFEAFCQQAHSDNCPDEPGHGDDSRFGCAVGSRLPVKAGYQDLQLWTTSCQDGEDSSTHYSLAVRLAKGWFVATNVLTNHNRRRHTEELRLKELAVRPLAAGPGTTARAPLIVWRNQAAANTYEPGHSRETGTEFDYLVLAGVGPSGIPSYADPIQLATVIGCSVLIEGGEGPGSYSRRGELQYKFLPDGQLELSPAAKQTKLDLMIADEDLVRYLGRQRLAFP